MNKIVLVGMSLMFLSNVFPLFSVISKPQVFISSEYSLLDEPIEIEIRKLSPSERIKLQMEVVDDLGKLWISWAEFAADSSGIVSLNRHAPIDGTYSGLDEMGLFWSLKNTTEPLSAFKVEKDTVELCLKLMIDNQVITSQRLYRLKKSLDVKRISINENGLVGCLFLPPSEEPLPVVITFTGSNGGLSENKSKLLASHGFAVFALGYFGVDGLPNQLEKIPMEYFERAFEWLKSRSDVDGTRIGLYGTSRGGELVLILGSLFPNSMKAIVSAVPSSVYYAAVGSVANDIPAWTYKGKPLGIAPYKEKDLPENYGKDPQYPIALTPNFLQSMQENPEMYASAAIPVENIKSPLMVISGGDDQMWPSSLYARQIHDRLAQYKSPIPFIHLDYPLAGHQIGIPAMPHSGSTYYHPVTKEWYAMGGTPQNDDRASRDSWKKIIEFFRNHL